MIFNRALTYDALALATVSLSLPPNAPVGYRDLMGRDMGEHRARKALALLEAEHYRFRFRTRASGQIRELVVMFDTPVSVGEALCEIQGRMESGAITARQVVACPSHPAEFTRTTPAGEFGLEDEMRLDEAPAPSTVSMPAVSSVPTGGVGESAEPIITAVPLADNPETGISGPVDNYETPGSNCPTVTNSGSDPGNENGGDFHRAWKTSARWEPRDSAVVETDSELSTGSHRAGITGARWTGARSAAAHISKDISNNSSLRSELTNQPTQPEILSEASGMVGVVDSKPEHPEQDAGGGVPGGTTPHPAPAAVTPVRREPVPAVEDQARREPAPGGSGRPDAGQASAPPGSWPTSSTAQTQGSRQAWAASLIGECVPRDLVRFLAPARFVAVARDLQVALDAGWERAEIRAQLAGNALGDAHNPGGVIAHRIRDIALANPPRPPKPRTAVVVDTRPDPGEVCGMPEGLRARVSRPPATVVQPASTGLPGEAGGVRCRGSGET
ncbi:hypothetical protein [Actinotignum sanguinis]|uniref:hypothetical protein n=1 Tax=Actinotignum sanguinis TaxID=1445614 RepID=UPI00254F0576|nr:hypothetical protein [Actinotignum sanguinis]MDK8657761.1 hypothetical protein [Actinotignum sanguinis]